MLPTLIAATAYSMLVLVTNAQGTSVMQPQGSVDSLSALAREDCEQVRATFDLQEQEWQQANPNSGVAHSFFCLPTEQVRALISAVRE
ncbi:hypothetical protein [Palleronia abyssalis]|uniref:Secreted protein n=1 Tax=Palleronia abyssalis TaxID=1501240 RepID=A0A2R8BPW6_9RHOB|nr:hypothetical protein [Palleronia abyssalis]SPJ22222.1 hypothetical protein PAA8504_00009 [Palleronia abyssalis]